MLRNTLERYQIEKNTIHCMKLMKLSLDVFRCLSDKRWYDHHQASFKEKKALLMCGISYLKLGYNSFIILKNLLILA